VQATLGYFYVFLSVYFTKLPAAFLAAGWAFSCPPQRDAIPFDVDGCSKSWARASAADFGVVPGPSLAVLALTNNVWVAMASQILHAGASS
jgi:hypothetical protein